MSFERVLSWTAVLAGGLSPILVSFVALVIGRSRGRKVYYRTLASQRNRADGDIALTVLAGQSRSGFSRPCTADSMVVQRSPALAAEARGPAPDSVRRG
jgi:hypothetical protein